MKQLVIMPGGFHPFHAGHLALYQSAKQAFPDADVKVAASNDTSARPFPFALKEKLAQLAGVPPGNFYQVKSPFGAEEITSKYNPETTQLIFVRSEKNSRTGTNPEGPLPAEPDPKTGKLPLVTRGKRKGLPVSDRLQYYQPDQPMAPMSQHAYLAYFDTVEFGPGMRSATEIRSAWPTLNEKRKTALVMSLYPKTQSNPKLAATVVKMLDTAMGTEGVTEAKKELPQWKKDWYAKQKPNSWPKHPQPYHNPKWIDELSPEERKKLANQEVDEASDQDAVDALIKKHGWSMGRTAYGDLAFTWQGSKYVFYGERMRITLPDDRSISVVWGQKPDWQGRGTNELSFAQAVQKKLLTFDLPIWQALDRGQLTDSQAIQKFKAENERQAREAIAQGVNEASNQTNDSELNAIKTYAKRHYPNLAADPESAFDKWVQRSLMHSNVDDHEMDQKIRRMAAEIAGLKTKIQSLKQQANDTADYLDESR